MTVDPSTLPDLHPYLLRKIAWDILPHDDKAVGVMEALGLVPASTDVSEIEKRESQMRAAKTSSIGALVTTYASMATGVLGAATMAQRDDVTQETVQVYMQMTFDMIRVAAFAIIGMLIETDALRLGTNQVQHG